MNLFGWSSHLGDPFDAVNFCFWGSNWGSVNLVLLRQHRGFRRRPILYKLSSVWFAVGRLVSLQWLELSQTCLRWDRSRSIRFSSEVNLLFFRVGDGSLLRSIRRFLRWASSLNAAVGCCQRFVIEAASVLTDFFHLELVVVSSMVKSINYFWVLPTLSIRVKGKRCTFECWIVSRFSIGGYRLQRYAH